MMLADVVDAIVPALGAGALAVGAWYAFATFRAWRRERRRRADTPRSSPPY